MTDKRFYYLLTKASDNATMMGCEVDFKVNAFGESFDVWKPTKEYENFEVSEHSFYKLAAAFSDYKYLILSEDDWKDLTA